MSLLGRSYYETRPDGKRITTRFAGTVLDVTDRVLAEVTLRDAKELQRSWRTRPRVRFWRIVERLSDFASLMGLRAREKGITFELKAQTELPDMKEERVRCLDAGYTGFLSKPIQRSELVDALVRYRHEN